MTEAKPSLRDLFEAALAVPPADRAGFLDRHCDTAQRAAVERLLAADTSDETRVLDHSLEDLLGGIGSDGEPAPQPPPGTCVGPFTLIDKLGEGGSSIVYRAEREQAGVRQGVALKLLRRGLYTDEERRRFRRERLALAQLRHPGIARLIEGGVTDSGVPYIALELIEGSPITLHARARRLDLRHRLRLFVDVCRAVEAAHRALIVHRDLKPSNVLVTHEGEVKLLDFGIAKLLDPDADADGVRTQYQPMTPAYAAPEQFDRGQITTATDVYALGVLLGELITGQRREHGDTRTPSSQIGEDTEPGVLPAPPRVTRRLLRGDLDNIVLKATANEPDRRYVSAGALADDVERLLEGRPVIAHPPSPWYRARKFVVRHRGGVMVTAAFLLAILVSLGLALWQTGVAHREALRANAMRDFMVGAFVEAEPSVPREGPPRITEVVQNAITQARSDPRMNVDVRTELMSRLGAVLRVQGKLKSARETLQWNYDEATRQFGARAALTLDAGDELLRTLILTGDFDTARTLADALLERTPSSDTLLRERLLLDSATLATKQHDRRRALREGDDGLRLAHSLGDEDELAEALSSYGNVQLEVGEVAGAATTYEELLALRRKMFGPSHITVAAAHADLSRAYRRLGRLADAEREIRAALAIDAGALPKDDWRHSNHLNALTMVLLQQRDYAGALDAARESLRIDRIAYGQDHPETANDLNSVGMLEARLDHWDAAVEPLHDSLQLSTAKFGAENWETAVTRSNYGVVLTHAGQAAAGEAEIRHAIASLEAASEPDLDEIAATWEKLARARLDLGDTAGVMPALDRIDALLKKIGSPSAYWDGRAAELRATALLALGRDKDAAPLLASARSAIDASAHPDPVLRVEIPLLQAIAADALGDRAAARAAAGEGLARFAALKTPPARLARLAERVRAFAG